MIFPGTDDGVEDDGADDGTVDEADMREAYAHPLSAVAPSPLGIENTSETGVVSPKHIRLLSLGEINGQKRRVFDPNRIGWG